MGPPSSLAASITRSLSAPLLAAYASQYFFVDGDLSKHIFLEPDTDVSHYKDANTPAFFDERKVSSMLQDYAIAIVRKTPASILEPTLRQLWHKSFNRQGLQGLVNAFVRPLPRDLSSWKVEPLIQILVDHRIPFMDLDTFQLAVSSFSSANRRTNWTTLEESFTSSFALPDVQAAPPTNARYVPRPPRIPVSRTIGREVLSSHDSIGTLPGINMPRHDVFPTRVASSGASSHTQWAMPLQPQLGQHYSQPSAGPPAQSAFDAQAFAASITSAFQSASGFPGSSTSGNHLPPNPTPSVSVYQRLVSRLDECLLNHVFVNPCHYSDARLQKARLHQTRSASDSYALGGGLKIQMPASGDDIKVDSSFSSFTSGFVFMLQRMLHLGFTQDIMDDRLGFFHWLTSQCYIPEAGRTEFALEFMSRNEKSPRWSTELQNGGSHLMNAALKLVSYQVPQTPQAPASSSGYGKTNKRKQSGSNRSSTPSAPKVAAKSPNPPMTFTQRCRTREVKMGACRFKPCLRSHDCAKCGLDHPFCG